MRFPFSGQDLPLRSEVAGNSLNSFSLSNRGGCGQTYFLSLVTADWLLVAGRLPILACNWHQSEIA
jgi:hypothetical protein